MALLVSITNSSRGLALRSLLHFIANGFVFVQERNPELFPGADVAALNLGFADPNKPIFEPLLQRGSSVPQILNANRCLRSTASDHHNLQVGLQGTYEASSVTLRRDCKRSM